MDKIKQYFYKYIVTYSEDIDGNCELRTVTGLTFGKTFNEACAKLTDYFGEDRIEDMKIELVSDCNVLEEDELADLFDLKKNEEHNMKLFDDIRTGLTDAIEHEKGNLDLRTTTLSTDE